MRVWCPVLGFPSSACGCVQWAEFWSAGVSPARAKLDIIVHELHFQVCALLCSVEACQAWSFVLPGNSVPQKKGYSVIHHPNLDTFIVAGGGFQLLCQSLPCQLGHFWAIQDGWFPGQLGGSWSALWNELLFPRQSLRSSLWRRREAKTVGEDAGAFKKRGSREPFQESWAKNRALPFSSGSGHFKRWGPCHCFFSLHSLWVPAPFSSVL